MSFKLSFKAFLAEQDLRKQIVYVAQDLLDSPIIKIDTIKERDIETAKEVTHKFVNSAAGPWVINVFKAAWGKFIRIDPPKGYDGEKTFYVPTTIKEEK